MARIIVFFSTKGGVGKSLIASNVAIALAREQQKKVCLVDLDLQVVGDMAKMLNLNPTRAMVDLISFLDRKQEHINAQVKLYDFVAHSSMNVDLLPSVLRPQQAPHLKAESVKEVLSLLDKEYDFIIVDAGKSFSELLITTLSQSNLIALVVTPDILSIYQTKWVLDTLQFLNFPTSMVKLVLNRAESASSISWQEVRMSIPFDVVAQIPSEGKVVGQAVNRGIPVVLDSPRSRVARAIIEFGAKLASDDKLYLEHKEVDQARLRETVWEAPAQFWQTQGLTEQLEEWNPSDETDEILLLKRKIHSRLIDELNLKRIDLKVFGDPQKAKELKSKAEIVVSNILAQEVGGLISSQDVRRKLSKEVLDEALGLGPLEDLLLDPTVTDIMVNNKNEIYVERKGKIEFTSKKFISNEQVKTTIERIIAPIGRRIDESVPMVDARLPDGSRVNAIIPPLSLTGPTLTIRKFRKERFTAKDLVGLNTLTENMGEFLRACVVARKNIIVSGGTGSGKTTVLNVLSAFIPANERIITLEDAAELKLHQTHWVRLESRPPNIEGKGIISIRDLFRNTLRMRPDRIIIGECRGMETLDMLQAMNTGHDGSMTTIHANATQDVLVRLDSMILLSGVELPVRAIREMVVSAVNIIIHTARLSDGSRKIIQITEVSGMEDELHVRLQDIFVFRQSSVDAQGAVLGEFKATGYVPSFMEEIKVRGIPLSEDIFRIS